MTIVEKVINLLNVNKTMSLQEIYDSLPEYTKASVRGNINRYLSKCENPDFKRIDRGVYSVIEIISVKKAEVGKYSVNYAATYYNGKKEVSFFHRNYICTNPELKEGIYQRIDNFSSFEEMENHQKSINGILVHDDAVEVLKRLRDESFSLIVTDPPYRTISGGTGGENCPRGMLSKNDGKIFKHNNIEFSDYMAELYRVLKPDSHAYFFTNLLNLQKLMEDVKKVGFKIHNLLVWKKNNTTPNRWYMKNCEYILFCRKGKAKAIKDKGCQTVHEFDNIIGDKIHETEKPLDLLRMYIRNSSEVGDWLLDPFAGSNSTMVAAMLEDRRCMSIEIDETYMPKIKERMRHLLKTGKDFRECVNYSTIK